MTDAREESRTPASSGADETPSSLIALTRHEFAWFQDFIYRETGIHFKPVKATMLSARLARRLRQLGLGGFEDYIHHLETADADGSERRELVNAVTTNKTEFFRERHHFDFLRDDIVPALRARAGAGGPRRLRIWSAGCSTGEEPYSIAMTMRESLGPLTGWDVKIVATDIDTQVLATASEGVYPEDRLQPIPEHLQRRYFQRGRNRSEGLWRARPELKELVEFRQLNLNDDAWPFSERFDVIFCRNVIIYFDRQTQVRLFERFAETLDPQGWLFLGHSESLIGVSERFTLVKTTMHRLRQNSRPPARVVPEAPVPPPLSTRRIIVGEVFASRSPTVVRTLLGSCISASLFDPEARIGGLNHFLLPMNTADPEDDRGARYGVHAMELLINALMKLGAQRKRLVAKVFGGANVMTRMRSTVPERNINFIREFLQREDIPIVGERLGGNSGMEIYFETATGRARVRRLSDVPATLLSQQERERARALRDLEQPDDSRVILF